jgi:excisionase family DNA binding protein
MLLPELLQQIVNDTPDSELYLLLGGLDAAKATTMARLRLGHRAPELDPDVLVTMEDAAQYLKIDEDTARSMGRTGRLPTVKVGERGVRVRMGALREWVRSAEKRR